MMSVPASILVLDLQHAAADVVIPFLLFRVFADDHALAGLEVAEVLFSAIAAIAIHNLSALRLYLGGLVNLVRC